MVSRLRDFVQDVTDLIDRGDGEAATLTAARPLLAELIRHDDWLPDAFAQPGDEFYKQYLLYCDPRQRFSVVSFVWGPGQETPVHDHTVWGVLGVLRGQEKARRYEYRDGVLLPSHGLDTLECGQTDLVSPSIGDIHKVQNGKAWPSISIHLYGGNIGAISRRVFQREGGFKLFRSGYSSEFLPNIWL